MLVNIYIGLPFIPVIRDLCKIHYNRTGHICQSFLAGLKTNKTYGGQYSEKKLLPCQIDFILNRSFKDGVIDYLCEENVCIRLEAQYNITKKVLCSIDKKALKSIKSRCSSCLNFKYTKEKIKSYRLVLIDEMRKQGASKAEIDLVSDAIIINSMEKKRPPEEVAWALLQ